MVCAENVSERAGTCSVDLSEGEGSPLGELVSLDRRVAEVCGGT